MRRHLLVLTKFYDFVITAHLARTGEALSSHNRKMAALSGGDIMNDRVKNQYQKEFFWGSIRAIQHISYCGSGMVLSVCVSVAHLLSGESGH